MRVGARRGRGLASGGAPGISMRSSTGIIHEGLWARVLQDGPAMGAVVRVSVGSLAVRLPGGLASVLGGVAETFGRSDWVGVALMVPQVVFGVLAVVFLLREKPGPSSSRIRTCEAGAGSRAERERERRWTNHGDTGGHGVRRRTETDPEGLRLRSGWAFFLGLVPSQSPCVRGSSRLSGILIGWSGGRAPACRSDEDRG